MEIRETKKEKPEKLPYIETDLDNVTRTTEEINDISPVESTMIHTLSVEPPAVFEAAQNSNIVYDLEVKEDIPEHTNNDTALSKAIIHSNEKITQISVDNSSEGKTMSELQEIKETDTDSHTSVLKNDNNVTEAKENVIENKDNGLSIDIEDGQKLSRCKETENNPPVNLDEEMITRCEC